MVAVRFDNLAIRLFAAGFIRVVSAAYGCLVQPELFQRCRDNYLYGDDES